MQHDIEKHDNRGRTPLMLAVTLSHSESVGALLQHEANVNTENTQGWTGNNNIILSSELLLLLELEFQSGYLCSGARGSWHRQSRTDTDGVSA